MKSFSNGNNNVSSWTAYPYSFRRSFGGIEANVIWGIEWHNIKADMVK